MANSEMSAALTICSSSMARMSWPVMLLRGGDWGEIKELRLGYPQSLDCGKGLSRCRESAGCCLL